MAFKIRTSKACVWYLPRNPCAEKHTPEPNRMYSSDPACFGVRARENAKKQRSTTHTTSPSTPNIPTTNKTTNPLKQGLHIPQ